ncbi:MAG: DNA gyrase inhibitor YacG [Deltaproteobacteria bacterium]|nr:DNA gyrase inhibitor YacG [Deltaproteobacteria bacterium]
MTTSKNLRCPVCERPTRFEDEPLGPFCSERCRLIDLGAWASGSYRVADQPDWMDDDEFSESGPPASPKDER